MKHPDLDTVGFRLNPGRPADLKEAFNMSSLHPDIVKHTHTTHLLSGDNTLVIFAPLFLSVGIRSATFLLIFDCRVKMCD